MTRHQITRVRHETRRRSLTVDAIERLTPRMLRLGFASPELHDFVSASADDHIKLFVPSSDGPLVMRDFTPRSFDTASGRLVIDFALHEAGPAIQWAKAARIGDTLEIGGPRGSKVVPDDFDWYLLIGDETALPAIGRRVEELRAGVTAITAILVTGSDEAQSFQTAAAWTGFWAIRNETDEEAVVLRRVLDDIELPAGEGFVWIAAEAATARAVRSYIVDERGHPRERVMAGGYWVLGKADAHEKLDD